MGGDNVRKAGILMPIFSLPSPYGIGTLGAEARAFVDFLADAGQSCWQILPVGPTPVFFPTYAPFLSTFRKPKSEDTNRDASRSTSKADDARLVAETDTKPLK